MRQLRFALNCQDTVRTSLHRTSSSSVKRRYRSSSCIAESPNGLVQLRDLRRHHSARDPQFKYHVDGSDRFSDYDCRDSLATWVGPDTFICTGPASTAYYNAICLRTNLSAIFTSGCPRNENGWRSGRVQTHRFTELRSTQRCVFPSMYRRLKSTRLFQCYERKQIWSKSRN